jgi:hypothetical protein
MASHPGIPMTQQGKHDSDNPRISRPFKGQYRSFNHFGIAISANACERFHESAPFELPQGDNRQAANARVLILKRVPQGITSTRIGRVAELFHGSATNLHPLRFKLNLN